MVLCFWEILIRNTEKHENCSFFFNKGQIQRKIVEIFIILKQKAYSIKMWEKCYFLENSKYDYRILFLYWISQILSNILVYNLPSAASKNGCWIFFTEKLQFLQCFANRGSVAVARIELKLSLKCFSEFFVQISIAHIEL